MTAKQQVPVTLQVTNVYGRGDYSVTVFVGSEKKPVNLILDTGSSTLVVSHKAYSASKDSDLKATTMAQSVEYGSGGWYGPVVTTSLTFSERTPQTSPVILKNCHTAISLITESDVFGQADGILGLAYKHLNKGYNFTHYLQAHQQPDANTWPWPLPQDNQSFSSIHQLITTQPESDIKPAFTQLEQQGLSPNVFSLLTRRSSACHAADNQTLDALKNNPLNQGIFVLGDGELCPELYQGQFNAIDVLHDVYYNTHLDAIQVEGFPPCKAPALQPEHKANYFSNSIIDSGAAYLVLVNDLFSYFKTCIEKINPDFVHLLEPFKTFNPNGKGIPAEQVNLKDWPDLWFIFSNRAGKSVRLRCSPQDYWQIHAPTYNQIAFKILGQLDGWPNQSILGLPLLNGYLTVFDRSANTGGEIKFAVGRFTS